TILLVLRDRVATQRSGRGRPCRGTRLIDRRVEHADTVLRTVQRRLADVVDRAAGHVDGCRVDNDAVVVGAVDVCARDATRVGGVEARADVAAGGIQRTADGSADLGGGQVDAVTHQPGLCAGGNRAP